MLSFLGILVLFICFDGQTCAEHLPDRRMKREATDCKDRFRLIPDHTMCLPRTSSNIQLTDADRKYIVDYHNKQRNSVQPEAIDMLKMSWDTDLEDEAQRWAANCKNEHDKERQRILPGKFFAAQNLASIDGRAMNWTEVIDEWMKERSKFTYSGNNNYMVIGHYSQVVWATTYRVGCGAAKCDTTYLYICNYGPRGNVLKSGTLNVEKPYETGSKLKCGPSYTKNRLCDCGDILCNNEGRVNLTTCTCECTHAYFKPPHCEVNCSDAKDSSSCGKDSYTKAHCLDYPSVQSYCPYQCNVCPYAEVGYKERHITGNTASTYYWRMDWLTLITCTIIIYCTLYE